MLRTLLIALALIAIGVIAVFAFLFLRYSGCTYDTIYEGVSANGRYVARWVSSDCGMGAHGNQVRVQDRWFPRAPGLDGEPAGALITSDFFAIDRGSEIFWEGDVLVLSYRTRTAPHLERRAVGGARIETRAGS